jgi:phosphonate transport system substrate-binding protein
MLIRMASLMAENASFFYRATARYLTRQTGIPIEVIEDVSWQERERMLDRGQIDLAFICGLPYVRKVDGRGSRIELLAAPVMKGARYQGRPIYFSDVVVHRDTPFQSFADLRGASWAYNEPNSQSGYNLIRYHLARLGERSGYFQRVVEAGAHQTALRLVISGTIDATAIDSIVLEMELKLHPELAPHLRIVGTLGPSPIPPSVISRQVPGKVRDALKQALLGMHGEDEGREILDAAMIARFTEVADEEYNEIREMALEAEAICLTAPE